MPLVFIDTINETLKAVRVIQGDAGELVTGTGTDDEFTDSARQTQIDAAIRLWQEAAHEVFGMGLLPKEAASATITLQATASEYAMPSDFERFAGKSYETRAFRGATTGLIVLEYKGGYAQMLVDQPLATDYIGDPGFWAINPTNSEIRFDRRTATDTDGEIYNALYEKRIGFTSTMATETLPFSDTVINSLVPVVAEDWKETFQNRFNPVRRRKGLVKALSYMTQTQPADRWGRRRG